MNQANPAFAAETWTEPTICSVSLVVAGELSRCSRGGTTIHAYREGALRRRRAPDSGGCAGARAGAPNILAPSGKVTGDAISSDGTDPKSWDQKLDEPTAAQDNHRILYEDDERVLLVTVHPGEKEKVHHHRRPSILVVLGDRKVEDFDAKGNRLRAFASLPENFKWPLVLRWPPGAAHSIHKLDANKPFRAILIEVKNGFPGLR